MTGLHGQCTEQRIAFEICCFDDGSTHAFKKMHRDMPPLANVRYEEMPKNLGRAAIRNRLGEAAQYDWLLFLDCDAGLVSASFIKKYLEAIREGAVVYGGRCYNEVPPADPKLLFHWKYGREREQATVQQRQKSPWHGFMTNNFMIQKRVFLAIGFHEELTQYGHEDTLFGMELAQRQVPIIHLDNPMEHLGLEPAAVFLQKTDQALENLAFLMRQGIAVDTKLLRYFSKVQHFGIAGLMARFFPLVRPLFYHQITSYSPNLALFDLYKLFCLAWKVSLSGKTKRK